MKQALFVYNSRILLYSSLTLVVACDCLKQGCLLIEYQKVAETRSSILVMHAPNNSR